MDVGIALSSEDHGPRDLVRFAVAAEAAGFRRAWVTDHFHPWLDAQGQSPFVWAVLGGIASATERLIVGTGVTCPTVRMHPAIVAHASATAAVMLPGRFFFGVGSGEALNEHILGDPWPRAEIRLEMLEEAVAIIRRLWTGEQISHEGKHYRVESARLYTHPEEPPPVYVSAFGPKALELAARIGDGYVGTTPDADLIQSFDRQAGPGKPKLANTKCCWGPDQATARKMAHDLWPNMDVPGELSQVLPTPAHFEQASKLVTEEMVGESLPCGPDPEPFVATIEQYAEAGYTELYLHNIGPDQQGFFRFFSEEVRPRLS